MRSHQVDWSSQAPKLDNVDEKKNDMPAKENKEKEKVRRKAPIKIVLRRLPGNMTWEELNVQLDPIPETEFLQFVPANNDEVKFNFARAYFVFKNDEDIITFRDRFNGYVFIDSKGVESMGIVELAPNPRVPRHSIEDSKKRDRKCGTIETDLDYKRFLDERDNEVKIEVPPIEQRIKEIEENERLLTEGNVQETPLTQFMIRKSEERFKRIQEKRRTREEERRLRLQRLYEREQKERAERREAKKISEFRNSKIDRSAREGGSTKDKDKEIIADKKKKDEMNGEKVEEDEDEEGFVRVSKEDEKSLKKERASRKEYDELNASKDRNTRAERVDNVEEAVKNDEVKQNEEKKCNDSEKVADVEREKSAPRAARTVVNRLAGAKETSKKTSEKVDTSSKPPRRNKDRPERAIYQPGAARRQRAAAAAAAKNALSEGDDEKVKKAEGEQPVPETDKP